MNYKDILDNVLGRDWVRWHKDDEWVQLQNDGRWFDNEGNELTINIATMKQNTWEVKGSSTHKECNESLIKKWLYLWDKIIRPNNVKL